MEEKEINEINLDMLRETIELTRNSKGFGWKIRLREEVVGLATITRLEKLNAKMEENYGEL